MLQPAEQHCQSRQVGLARRSSGRGPDCLDDFPGGRQATSRNDADRAVGGALDGQDVRVDMYGFSGPLSRIHVRTVVVPGAAAVVCAAVAALVEVRTVAATLSACDVGINAAANSWILLEELLLLWVVQTVPVMLIAPLTALLSRRRLVVTALMAIIAVVVVAVVAWAYFALSGLPIQTPPWCSSPQPGWWPRWLPPAH